MKLLIAIILMVLTGVCFADVGDYRLNGRITQELNQSLLITVKKQPYW